MKTILVTGGAGFIGSHLCKRLIKEGHRVISLDNYFTGSRENHIAGVEYREGHTKDIANHVSETPDLIYHLGEYSRVEQSILEPDFVYDLNIVGTRGVIEFWQAKKCKLMYAGSSTKFGDGGLSREATPYASSKAKNSEFVRRIGETEKLPYAIAYFYNVYGPGERAGVYGTVIESFKHMYLAGAPLTVTAPGTQERNFTYVDDIVDGLILLGERGQGDEFGLGNEHAFAILEVARLFGVPVVMLPERTGNRMRSTLDTAKARSLGWTARHRLEDYISEFVAANPRGAMKEKRVLVFSTTFYPIAGPAEDALIALIQKMPDISFDVVTTVFSRHTRNAPSPFPNVAVYRVGFGVPSDKYFLPVLGYFRGLALRRRHAYIFGWSLMASYAALLGVAMRRLSRLPLLITLANQNLGQLSPIVRFFLRIILSDADQVYGMASQERDAEHLARRPLRRSIGEGDAFANQLRYAYAEILLKQLS